MGQLKSLERSLQKNDTLPKRYQGSFDSDVTAGCVRKNELNDTRDKLQWFFPHHSAINPHRHEKTRSVQWRSKASRCGPQQQTSICCRVLSDLFFDFVNTK